MFISDQLIFLELHKTGCSHVLRLLREVVPGHLRGKHNRPSSHLLAEGRKIIGSVRNPWDWYISLWAYGVEGRGSLHQRLTCRGLKGHGIRHQPLHGLQSFLRGLVTSKQYWRRVYSEHRPEHFRAWLRRLLDPRFRSCFGEGFNRSPVSEFAGPMTYRYLMLFSREPNELFQSDAPRNHEELRVYDRANNLLDHVIRAESLAVDLLEVLERCGVHLSSDQECRITTANRTNQSSRSRNIETYYDNETASLVNQREALVIDRFGYRPPQ